jgi:hypothetical protein
MAAALALAALVFIALGCSSASSRQLARDEVWRRKIVGSWSEGGTPYAVATFLPGGGYRGVIYLSAETRAVLLAVEGKWWIEAGRLYNKADNVEMVQPVPLSLARDKVSVDTIVDISDDAMRLIDERGAEYVKKRVAGEGERL